MVCNIGIIKGEAYFSFYCNYYDTARQYIYCNYKNINVEDFNNLSNE